MNAPKLTIGIDLGGTHTRVGSVDFEGNLLDARKGPTQAGPGATGLLDWITDRVVELADAAGAARAIGLAIPGALDEGRSMTVRAVNLPFLEKVPIRDELSRRTGLPVVLETDVAAAAWGEYNCCQPRPDRFVFLVIGTGIGAAAILDGRLLRHTHGGAGHLGQMIVDSSPDAPRGPCGTRGSLEVWAAGPALERAAERAGLPASLAELECLCKQGDTDAQALVARAAHFLSIGLVNVAYLYAPDYIAVGGGAAAVLPELVRRAQAGVAELGGDLVPPQMVVRSASLGDDAGIIGAAMLATGPTGI
jgi:glucokinase